jgi:pimeloyl-ACP methyl ester carboxylesterase
VLEVRRGGRSEWGFKFAVVIGGPFPPMVLMGEGEEDEAAVDLDYGVMRLVPTVHAWGRDDQVRRGAKEMAEAFDGLSTFVMDFEGGHHLPLTDPEADELCGLIVEAWHAGGGKDQKGLVNKMGVGIE